MAVFMINICKYSGCGITFRTLGDLIQHIEDTHLDFDPRVLEKQELQQPPCLPLSYILRFFTDAAKKENLELAKKQKGGQSPVVSVCSTTPTGSEFDEDDLVSESENSNDSWTTQEEFSSEFILRYGSRIVGNANSNEEKPFACPVPGCKKRYKNINGIKYHAKNGHRKDGRVKKAFKCQCGKSYKTTKGLRAHNIAHHSGAVPALAEPIPCAEPLQVSTVTSTVVVPSSPSSVTNLPSPISVQSVLLNPSTAITKTSASLTNIVTPTSVSQAISTTDIPKSGAGLSHVAAPPALLPPITSSASTVSYQLLASFATPMSPPNTNSSVLFPSSSSLQSQAPILLSTQHTSSLPSNVNLGSSPSHVTSHSSFSYNPLTSSFPSAPLSQNLSSAPTPSIIPIVQTLGTPQPNM